jgi:hypothetical protein
MSSIRTVVISQPMLFPWVGMFEQIRLADVFVYYDDVQFSKGSFTNRIQLKTAKGSEWMTIPLGGIHLGQRINEVAAADNTNWRGRHMEQLERHYADADYLSDMIALVESVYALNTQNVAEIAIASMRAICDYFGLTEGRQFVLSSGTNIQGSSSERVLNFVQHYDATRYVTGLGAIRYLDHELFDAHGIAVEYMDYKKLPYPQLHLEFTPYVSILDLIANCGKDGATYICSQTNGWREISTK